MIPILYAPGESNFGHGGIGALFETTSCVVGEERNGAFEIEFKYPVDGRLYKYIEEGCIVKAKPNDTADPQLFSIYRSTKPINGIVTFYGEHISYELSGNPVESVEIENETAQDAMEKVFAAAILPHNYTAYSDITTRNSTRIACASARGALGGVAGSILSVWGGEYEFDNFTVKLHSSRGTNTGIKIAYGKNLTDLQQEKNISEVYVGVYPYAKYTPQAEENATEQPEEVVVSLSEKIIWSPHAAEYARKRVCIKDFSDRFNGASEITEEQLREVVEAWVETSGFDVPAVSITVSFAHLWHSPEYAQYAPLERVNLCDLVSVEYPKLGISETAKVIKTKYDVLNEKYLSITLGSAKANFADTVNQTSAAIEQTKQEIKQSSAALSVDIKNAVDEATQAITGQSGGYVVLNPSKNPQEILIMDASTIAEAENIWRWNSGGFGHSKNGYNGPFGTAITQDGAIVADFITAGTLRAIEIAACTINGGSLNINNKFVVTTNGDATVEGKVTATSGTIGGCEISGGVLKIKNANISEKLTAGSIDVSGVIAAGGIAVLGDVEAEAERAEGAENTLSSRISANAEEISAEVERAEGAESSLSSKITQNARAITAKVSSSGGSSSTFGWSLTSSGFYLYSGSETVMEVTSSGLEVTGTVKAEEGAIGPWTLSSEGLYARSSGTARYSGMKIHSRACPSLVNSSANSYVRFFAGSVDNNPYPDRGATDTAFAVLEDGSLYATAAKISGTIDAISGKIAAFSISGDALVGTNVGMCGEAGENWAFWAGSDGENPPFRVGHDGSLTATNANLSGTFFNMDGTWGLKLISNRIEFIQNNSTVATVQGSSGYYNAAMSETVNCVAFDSAVRIGGDLILGRNLGFSDGNSFYMNGTRCLCGWIKYVKEGGFAGIGATTRYMRFVNGLLVAESNEIWENDYLRQIN